ncbi:hypothetical protein M0805_005899 [Coniferiporia weirii]|nr:hypothetical protein M0805_005899 [Coniferiporia weirii]
MTALFSGAKSEYFDFSYDLRDRRDWKIATIREAEYLSGISALAVEPTNGLLAIGTKSGKILVFGAPPTATILNVPRAAPVKFLQFAALVFRLLCVDDKGVLHVWDLSQLGRPKIVASEAYKEPICSLTVSPCHSHAFVGLERGTISTYDILCLNRSPYIIPDLWKAHERHAIHGGMPLSHVPNASDLMDAVIHPRDLNNLFIAYAGGVVLYDLAERKAIHHYQLVIPPGAPGAIGYYDPEIMRARMPALTSIAIHASGQLFATGHLDGTIALWAVDDEDRPLMVRTIEKIDINYPEGEELDRVLSDPNRPPPETMDRMRLEPIFKLTWNSFGSQTTSDPYSGNTVLTILGGYAAEHEPALTALRFPPVAFASLSAPASREGINPDVRKAISKMFSSVDVYHYSTVGVVVDYLQIPKDSANFGGGHDPLAILVLSDWPQGQRNVEAKEFPPPVFGISEVSITPASNPTSGVEDGNPLDAEISSALKSLKITSDPQNYTESLPSVLWVGLNAIRDGDIVRLEKGEYDRLQLALQVSDPTEPSIIGRGGIAWVDYGDHDQVQSLMFTKRQPHRFLVTHHRDLTVRFQDISAQLLLGSASSPLTTPFPVPLTRLTIALPQVCSEPCVSDARYPITLAQAEIQSAQLTSESCECAVVMRSGHVIVYSFDERQRNPSKLVDEQDDLVLLTHIPASAGTFQPMFMIENVWGAVTACELSNIGFLAVAYGSGALIIIDMRHPKIIFRDLADAKAQKRISVALHLSSAEDEKRVVSLRWFVCGFDEDATPRVRLLVSHHSSTVRLFTLSQSSSRVWAVDEDVKKFDGTENPLPRGMFVLQAKNGTSRTASRATFKEALQGGEDFAPVKEGREKHSGPHCFWVSAGEKGAKCHANFVGSKVGKTDWGKGRKIESVEVVDRNGAQGLIAIMDTREAIVYSLPELEPIHTFQLNKRPNSAICLDDTGDFVDWVFDLQADSVCEATLGTFFATRRVYDEPVIDYTTGRRAAPGIPPRVPLGPISYLGSWFNFKKGLGGDAIDALLAGPNRSIPQDSTTTTVLNSQWQTQMQIRAQALANQASQTGSNLYTNLSAAVSERGDMLAGLDGQLQSLSEGGRKMMFEAKRLAAEQTGKRWFGF